MNIEQTVFRLIHSLKKSEKRNFKLYVSKYSGGTPPNIVYLFDAINKSKKYDEEKIKKAVQKRISASSFHYEKFRLKNQILNSLNDLYFNGTDQPSLGEILNKIELGFQLDIPEIIEEWLDRGKKMVEANQSNYYKIVLHSLEAAYLVKKKERPAILSEFSEKGIEICKELALDLEIWAYKDQVADWFMKYLYFKNEEAEAKRKKIFTSKVFNLKEEGLTFHQKRGLFFIKTLYFSYIQEPEKNLLFQRKIIELFESDPKYLNPPSFKYFKHFFNFIIQLANTDHWEEAMQGLVKLKMKLKKYKFNRKIELEKECQLIELNLNCRKEMFEGKFEQIYQRKEEILESTQLSKDLYEIIPVSTLYFIDATFRLNHLEECLKFIEHFHDFKLSKVNLANFKYNDTFILIIVQLYELVCHYESGHFTVAESKLNSIQYHWRKLPNNITTEEWRHLTQVIRLLNKMIQGSGRVSDLPTKLSPLNNLFFSLNSLIDWAKKKIVE